MNHAAKSLTTQDGIALAPKTSTRTPRYLLDLNSLLRKFGINAQSEEIEFEGGIHIRTRWEGSISALRRTALLPPSYAIPLSEGAFQYPKEGSWRIRPVIRGRLFIHGKHFVMTATQAAPAQVSVVGTVEVAHYEDWTEHYGSERELMERRMCERLPNKKRGFISWELHNDGAPELRWFSRRLPNNSYLFCRETDQARIARLQDRLEFLISYGGAAPYVGTRNDIAKVRAALSNCRRAFEAKADPTFSAFLARLTTPPLEDSPAC